MSALTVRLPESLHQNIRLLAEREGISANQFIASAVAEKMASVMTLKYLQSEAALAKRSDFEEFLASVPDAVITDDAERLK